MAWGSFTCPLDSGVWARLPCTYLILAMEKPLTAIAQPRRTKGFLPCGHRAGSDPTATSKVKIWTFSLSDLKKPQRGNSGKELGP